MIWDFGKMPQWLKAGKRGVGTAVCIKDWAVGMVDTAPWEVVPPICVVQPTPEGLNPPGGGFQPPPV